jgi:hypothetical protein
MSKQINVTDDAKTENGNQGCFFTGLFVCIVFLVCGVSVLIVFGAGVRVKVRNWNWNRTPLKPIIKRGEQQDTDEKRPQRRKRWRLLDGDFFKDELNGL